MKETYVLRRLIDVEDFDYDGGGDYWYVDTEWTEFESESELLKYLQDNIYDGVEDKPLKFKSVKDYVNEYGFQVFKRIY